MKYPRIYYQHKLVLNNLIELKDDNYHYLINVLRKKETEHIILFDQYGASYNGEIIKIKRNKFVTIEVKEAIVIENQSKIKIYLGQAVVKADKMKFVIQKSVELGVFNITPILLKRSLSLFEGDGSTNKIEHWNKISINASQQCGRVDVAIVKEPMALESWIKTCNTDLNVILDPHANSTFQSISHLSPQSISILIGPEGGFETYEVEIVKKYGFMNLRLGPRILRTETSSICALSVIQYIFGDLNL